MNATLDILKAKEVLKMCVTVTLGFPALAEEDTGASVHLRQYPIRFFLLVHSLDASPQFLSIYLQTGFDMTMNICTLPLNPLKTQQLD